MSVQPELTNAQPSSRRRAVRRAVHVECAVRSPLWDGSANYVATDLSPQGLWLSSDLALERGAPLQLSFRPPHWPDWASPVTAVGEVVRASVPRRRTDRGPAGMGVCFKVIDPGQAQHMAMLLQGLPPPLRRPTAIVIEAVDPDSVVLLDDADELELLDFEARLSAEAPLLTAGRPAPRPLSAALRARAARRPRADARKLDPAALRPARRLLGPRKPLLRLVG